MCSWSLCECYVGEPGPLLNCCFKWVNCLCVKFTAIKREPLSMTLKMPHCPTQGWSNCGNHVLRQCPLRDCSESHLPKESWGPETPDTSPRQMPSITLWDLSTLKVMRWDKAAGRDGPRLTCGEGGHWTREHGCYF